MQGQLDDAKQARLPFLSVKEIQIIARENIGYPKTWEAVLIWENTGGTEAIDISAKIIWFEDAQGMGERHVVLIPEFFLAPHLATDATRFSISDDLLKMVWSGKKQIIVQWIAIYRDKFGAKYSSESRHETRQGWVLDRIDDDPDKIKINNIINVRLAPLAGFTCVDDGCKNTKQ